MAGGGSRRAARNNARQDSHSRAARLEADGALSHLSRFESAGPGRRFRRIAFRSTVERGRRASMKLAGRPRPSDDQRLRTVQDGIGPSSSHTIGPMKAAAAFVDGLVAWASWSGPPAVVVALLGSLAFTGKGHGTDKAVILGLAGERPRASILTALRRSSPSPPDEGAAPRRAREIAFDPERASVRHAHPRPAPPEHDAIFRARRGRRSSPTSAGSRSAAASSPAAAPAR